MSELSEKKHLISETPVSAQLQVKCPLCRGTDVTRKDGFSHCLDLIGNTESRVFGCTCGMRFLWRHVSGELLDSLYAESYFTGEEAKGEAKLAPASKVNYDVFADARTEKFIRTVDLLIELKPDAKTILDVGAATGVFLANARSKGLVVDGVELSAYAANLARERFGLDFFVGRLETYEPKKKFDLIHLNHVLEHVVNPHEVVDKLLSMLSDGGLIYVEVPYQFNIVERLKTAIVGKNKKFDVYSVHHPLFFTPRTLERLFTGHGTRLLQMRVFEGYRYNASGFVSALKKVVWWILSLGKQGLYVEGIFRKT